MSVTTTTGKPIGDYNDYKNNIPEGGSASTFEQTAKIPLAGKYNVSDETMETRSVLLSELGGSGLPSTSGNEGKFLTVNSSEEAVWGDAPKAVTAITAGAGMAVSGSVSVSVAINTSTANDGECLKYDDGAITWGGINEVPSISGASNGDVLTVSNGAATWAAPGGGGGYTPVTITPAQSQVSGTSLDVNVNNHTLVTLDLSNINPASVDESYGLENVNINASVPAAGDYLDIMVQIKPFDDTDGIQAQAYLGGSPMPLLKTNTLDNYLDNRWICLHLIGNVCILTTEPGNGE